MSIEKVIYLAPMEGITGYVFRNAYHKYYGNVDKYFTPFIGNKKMNSRERRDVLPENNKDIPLIPQILTNRSEDFLIIAKTLGEFGYDEVNLNLGCPSGTVASRGRGAGFLGFPKELDAFLNEIFNSTDMKISIKTRIGVKSEEEWNGLLNIYSKYPMTELIIHPRLQTDFYKNHPRKEAYAKAEEKLNISLCYNGDICSSEDYEELIGAFPSIDKVMIGRGLIKKPWLISSIKEGAAVDRNNLRKFHQSLVYGYMDEMNAERDVLFRMKEFWSYLGQSFTGDEKLLKKIRKSNNINEYMAASEEIIMGCGLEE